MNLSHAKTPRRNTVIGFRFSVFGKKAQDYQQVIAIAKSFFRLIIFIVGAQRAVPSDHRRARQAVPLQNEITFGNRYRYGAQCAPYIWKVTA